MVITADGMLLNIFKLAGSKTVRLAGAAALVLSASPAQAATINETFGVGTSFANGPGSLAFSLTGLDTAVITDMSLAFSFFGDLNANNETFELFLDGTSYGVGCDNNTGNDSFGIEMGGLSDQCVQTDNTLGDANLLVAATDALGLLADGALDVVFNFSDQVDAFVAIDNGGETRNGVTFANVSGVSFGVGGTVSYETSTIAPIPVSGTFPLLALGMCAFGFMGRRALNA